MISFSFIDTPTLNLKKLVLKSCIKGLITNENFKCKDISFIFCSDEYLLSINQEYLKHDYFTDIITFDYCEVKNISGDLFISIDRVKENANNNSVTFANELTRVLFHGVLHLCGYKDKSTNDKSFMSSREDFYLNNFKEFSIL